MKKIISVICAAVILLSLAGCGTKLEGAQPDGEIESNGGIAVKQGDWLYFIAGGMPSLSKEAEADTLRGKICRMRDGDSGSSFDVVSPSKAYTMYIFKDRIFYTTPAKSKICFASVGTDGTGYKRIFSFDDGKFIAYGPNGAAIEKDDKIVYIDYTTLKKTEFDVKCDTAGIYVTENYIYYYAQNVASTNRLSIETGNIESLCTDIGMFLYADDTEVYFVSTRIPYRLNANTLELNEISTSHYKSLIFNKKHDAIIAQASDTDDLGLYFQPAGNIAGAEHGEDGNKPRFKLHTSDISAYCLNDDYIFFVETETGDIYRMDYEGKNKTVLGNVPSVYSLDSIDVAGKNLFVFDDTDSGYAYTVPIDGSGTLVAIKED